MKKSLLTLKKIMIALPIVLLCLLLSFNTKAQTVNPIVVKFTNVTHTTASNGYSDSLTFHIQVTVGTKIIQTWYYGDTTIVVRPGKSAGKVQGHIFKYAGTYNVTLVVTDTITGTANQTSYSLTTVGFNPKPVVVKPFHYGPYTSNGLATATLNTDAKIASGNMKYFWQIAVGSGGNAVTPFNQLDSFTSNGTKYPYISNDSLQNPQVYYPQTNHPDTIYTTLTVWGLNSLAVTTTSIQDTIVIPALATPPPTPTAAFFVTNATAIGVDTFKTNNKVGCSEVFSLTPVYTVPGTDSFNVTWYFGDGSATYIKTPSKTTGPDSIAKTGVAFTKLYSYSGLYSVYFVVTDLNTGLYATSSIKYLVDSTGYIPLAPTPTFTVNNITSDSITRFGYGYRFNSSYLTDSLALVNLQATTYGNYNYVWSIQYTGTSSGIPAQLSGLTIPSPLDSTSSIQLALTRPDSVLAGVSYPAYSAATEPYTVTLTINPVGCAISQSTNVVIWDSISDFASVGTNSVKGHVSTYPNPARGNVTVNTTLNKASAYVTVSVYDITGKLKQASKVDASNKVATINLNVANLSTGYYKIKVTNAEGQLIEVKSIFKN